MHLAALLKFKPSALLEVVSGLSFRFGDLGGLTDFMSDSSYYTSRRDPVRIRTDPVAVMHKLNKLPISY